ncbi:hypothetical protein DFH06DRAFT_1121969 [Mycena polygramma]|nr:hypothetical protein DFH06DRAFT_1121969 [Mycena polygramma]
MGSIRRAQIVPAPLQIERRTPDGFHKNDVEAEGLPPTTLRTDDATVLSQVCQYHSSPAMHVGMHVTLRRAEEQWRIPLMISPLVRAISIAEIELGAPVGLCITKSGETKLNPSKRPGTGIEDINSPGGSEERQSVRAIEALFDVPRGEKSGSVGTWLAEVTEARLGNGLNARYAPYTISVTGEEQTGPDEKLCVFAAAKKCVFAAAKKVSVWGIFGTSHRPREPPQTISRSQKVLEVSLDGSPTLPLDPARRNVANADQAAFRCLAGEVSVWGIFGTSHRPREPPQTISRSQKVLEVSLDGSPTLPLDPARRNVANADQAAFRCLAGE